MSDVYQLIESLYDSASGHQNWDSFAHNLMATIGGKTVVIHFADFSQDSVHYGSALGLSAEETAIYQRDYFPIDGINKTLLRTPQGFTGLTKQLISDKQLMAMSGYEEFYNPFDIHQFAFSCFERHDQQAAWVSIGRSINDPAFSQADSLLLSQLNTHFLRASKIWNQLSRLKNHAQIASGLSSTLGIGFALLNKRGQVIGINQQLEALLNQQCLSLHTQAIKLPDYQTQNQLEALISKTLTLSPLDHNSNNNLVYKTTTGHNMVVQCFPWYPTFHPVKHQESGGHAILFFYPLVEKPLTVPQQLQKHWQLSNAELAITQQLANGLSIKEISELLFISQNTVRFHVKNIFAKTGSHKQSELIALLFKSIPPITIEH
jgi:DNA-binding CsgD family transcriptional regulator